MTAAMASTALIALLATTQPYHPAPLEPSDTVAELVAGVKLGEAFGRIVGVRYGPTIQGTATHYGPSYQSQPMGCGGRYDTANPVIVAVSPARYAMWPCGTEFEIAGPGGTVRAIRTDACPGCSANMVDLSEAGSSAVCGGLPHTCSVTIREVLR